MPYLLQIHELAHAEFIETYDWYENEQTGLGDQFMTEVERALDIIVSQPLLNAKINRNFRKAIVASFPYIVIYEFYPKLETIHVASIRHMKRGKRGRYRRKQTK